MGRSGGVASPLGLEYRGGRQSCRAGSGLRTGQLERSVVDQCLNEDECFLSVDGHCFLGGVVGIFLGVVVIDAQVFELQQGIDGVFEDSAKALELTAIGLGIELQDRYESKKCATPLVSR